GHLRNRARDDFFVECPEVFDRPPAATDDHDVDAAHAGDGAQPPRDVERRALSLDARGTDDEVGIRITTLKHLDDVANSGALERGDDADLPGERGQRTLP